MYQWVKNVSFSENFAYVLDEWSPYKEVYLTPFPATGLILYTLEKSENCYIKKMFICENVKWGCNYVLVHSFVSCFRKTLVKRREGSQPRPAPKSRYFFVFPCVVCGHFVGWFVSFFIFAFSFLFCSSVFWFCSFKVLLWKRNSILYLGLKIKLFRKYPQTALYHQVSIRSCQCDFRILERKTGLVAKNFYIMEFSIFLRNPFQTPFWYFQGV